MADWGQIFFDHFASELARAGYSPEASVPFMWRPVALDGLNILGPQRDRDLGKLAVRADDIRAAVARRNAAVAPAADALCHQQKIVLVLLPGYTHETLRHLSWHDTLEQRDSPHHIVLLRPGAGDGTSIEETTGAVDGLKLVYVSYPRSNAASDIIGPGLFQLLHNSSSLRRWTNEGYRLFFVGYSNGAPLSLELLADLNCNQYADEFLLQHTAGMLALCGDIGGAYLADDLLSEQPQLVNFRKLLAFAKHHPLIARLLGLGTQQLQADALEGVRSLGHAVRQARMADYAARLPAHVKYFSVAAVMPMQDYRRRWWQLNLDDWSMYRQAQVTEPLTLYNDGQVSLDDNQLPSAVENRIFLGAVRTHHWGVAYRTFNQGRNRFPRQAFYRALMQTIVPALQDHS